jgi:hypothetical protein
MAAVNQDWRDVVNACRRRGPGSKGGCPALACCDGDRESVDGPRWPGLDPPVLEKAGHTLSHSATLCRLTAGRRQAGSLPHGAAADAGRAGAAAGGPLVGRPGRHAACRSNLQPARPHSLPSGAVQSSTSRVVLPRCGAASSGLAATIEPARARTRGCGPLHARRQRCRLAAVGPPSRHGCRAERRSECMARGLGRAARRRVQPWTGGAGASNAVCVAGGGGAVGPAGGAALPGGATARRARWACVWGGGSTGCFGSECVLEGGRAGERRTGRDVARLGCSARVLRPAGRLAEAARLQAWLAGSDAALQVGGRRTARGRRPSCATSHRPTKGLNVSLAASATRGHYWLPRSPFTRGSPAPCPNARPSLKEGKKARKTQARSKSHRGPSLPFTPSSQARAASAAALQPRASALAQRVAAARGSLRGGPLRAMAALRRELDEHGGALVTRALEAQSEFMVRPGRGVGCRAARSACRSGAIMHVHDSTWQHALPASRASDAVPGARRSNARPGWHPG